MKKLIRTFLLAVLCTVVVSTAGYGVSAQADDTGNVNYKIGSGSTDIRRFYDEAGLIYDGNESEIEEKLRNLSDKYGVDVIVAFCSKRPSDYDSSYTDRDEVWRTQQFACDFYAWEDYYHEGNLSDDGLIFMLCDEDRTWAIESTGILENAIDHSSTDYIFDQIKSSLSDDLYTTAVDEFIEQAEIHFEGYRTGNAYVNGKHPQRLFDWGLRIVVWIVIGLVIGLIRVGSMKSQLKSVAVKTEASDYIVPGSFNLKNSRDFFLYKTVTRVKRESSSSSGGGSHHSSGGRSFSGGGGHY
ncbi:MAG: TPM domain-containing protein [Lachnospiraceae bacterium]|nr:TPM domain-containing protein [Lachnospiraceae bacterium]